MTRRPRVCFFNRSYWPDTGATGQLLTELAEDLAAQHGFDVTVIAGDSTTSTAVRPRQEDHNGVHVIRARGTRFAPRRFAGRAANYLTYFISAMAAARRLPPHDVVVAMTDPPIIGLAALYARRGTPFVFFCQDIFPEVAALLADFRSRAADHVLARVTRHLVARADRVVALGETMAERLVSGKGADPARVRVIHNWADVDAISPAPKINTFSETHGLADMFVVLHAGNIGMGQDLDAVIDAAEKTTHRHDIVWLFIGDGTRRAALVQRVAQRKLANVRFLPFQPRDLLKWTYASADVCLVSLKAGLAGYIVPSKMYPSLASGRPLVAMVDRDSEVAQLTAIHECGVVVPPGDRQALADAVVSLADDSGRRQRMGDAARRLALQFDRRTQVALHAAMLREIGRE
jgi:glycosyltransferase involved in cell wall biosynthesis